MLYELARWSYPKSTSFGRAIGALCVYSQPQS